MYINEDRGFFGFLLECLPVDVFKGRIITESSIYGERRREIEKRNQRRTNSIKKHIHLNGTGVLLLFLVRKFLVGLVRVCPQQFS